MDYFVGKELVTRLSKGLESNQPAQFTKREEESILSLIANDMVRPNAFLNLNKIKYGSQNLAEKTPVTNKGRQLYNV